MTVRLNTWPLCSWSLGCVRTPHVAEEKDGRFMSLDRSLHWNDLCKLMKAVVLPVEQLLLGDLSRDASK